MQTFTTEQYEKYRGKWVAEFEGEIIASGWTYDEALEQAQENGYEIPSSLSRIPREGEVVTFDDFLSEVFGIPK